MYALTTCDGVNVPGQLPVAEVNTCVGHNSMSASASALQAPVGEAVMQQQIAWQDQQIVQWSYRHILQPGQAIKVNG